jgi:hypothetical protein
LQLVWRWTKRILPVFVLTFVCGFGGIVFHLISDNSSPLSFAELLCGYLLAWPLILIEHWGGVEDFMGRSTPAQHWAIWSAWSGLWVYYYVLLAFWRKMRRKQ